MDRHITATLNQLLLMEIELNHKLTSTERREKHSSFTLQKKSRSMTSTR